MSTYTIMGIDPGTSTVGVAIYHYENNRLTKITSELIDVSKENNRHKLNTHLDVRLTAIATELSLLYKKYNPIAVAMEHPFINARRPTSIIPLARSIEAIIHTALLFNPNIFIYKPAPTKIKAYVKVKDFKSKTAVLNAMLELDEIKGIIENPFSISEHEIDGVVIGYLLHKLIEEAPFIPYIVSDR